MPFLKADFQNALKASVLSRPAAAAYYRAGDPRLLAMMDAASTMLAMLSQQFDAAETEPFIKARMGTVLADATLKGILPLAKPARVTVAVANTGTAAVTIAAGRVITDAKGRRYVVEGSATIAGSATGSVSALQLSTRVITHTVAGSAPFYEVEVPGSPEAMFLAGIDVADAALPFTYSPDFANVNPGQRVFHVETDEYRRVFVRFGAADGGLDVVGHQPLDGDVLTITVRECGGLVTLDAGATFALEYVTTSDEALLNLTLGTVDAPGAAPPDAETLRMLTRYPALHDSNAVFLADFDFLLRRHLSGVHFLSVWNEQVEEVARGPSVANINKLFVSFVIPSVSFGVSEGQVRSIIGRADDSYEVVIIAPRLIEVPVQVTASVAAVHDAADVEAQIRAVLQAQYGQGSLGASRGGAKPKQQQIAAALKASVPALQDQVSDFHVVLGATPAALPEDYRYFSPLATTVTVERITDATGLWSL